MQPENNPLEMEVTLFGMEKDVRLEDSLVQPENERSPMLVIPFSNMIVVTFSRLKYQGDH